MSSAFRKLQDRFLHLNKEMVGILLAPLFLEDMEQFSYGGWINERFFPVPWHAGPKKTRSDPTFYYL